MTNECFIITPISTSPEIAERHGGDQNHFRHVIDHLLIPAVERAGFAAIPPEAQGADLIHAGIVRHLESCAMVLCDMTSLNPNVFYELGIRTAVNLPFALIRDESTLSIPFDTHMINTHSYDGTLVPWRLTEQIERLADHIEASFERSNGKNQMWEFFGLTTRASFVSVDESSIEEKIDFLISRSWAPAVLSTREIDNCIRHLFVVVVSQIGGRTMTTDSMMSALGEMESELREVVEHRFGLDGSGLRTLEDVGTTMGISRERARKLEAIAIKELAYQMTSTSPEPLAKS